MLGTVDDAGSSESCMGLTRSYRYAPPGACCILRHAYVVVVRNGSEKLWLFSGDSDSITASRKLNTGPSSSPAVPAASPSPRGRASPHTPSQS